MPEPTKVMFMLAAIEEAKAGLAEGGVPIGSVLNDATCQELMRQFIAAQPDICNEDIGET